MFGTHKEALFAAFYGYMTLILLLAPFIIYYKDFHEKEKSKGSVGGGDILSMLMEAFGIHIGLFFIFVTGFEFMNIIFRAVTSLSPSEGLKNFFLTKTVTDNTFVDKWVTTTFNAGVNDGGELGASVARGFDLLMKFTAIGLTIFYIAIPIMLLVLSIRQGFGANTQQNESAVTKIVSSFVFFVASTSILFIHTLISSVLVMILTKNTSFSFFESIQATWHKLLFG